MNWLDGFSVGLLIGMFIGLFIEYAILWGKYIKHHMPPYIDEQEGDKKL